MEPSLSNLKPQQLKDGQVTTPKQEKGIITHSDGVLETLQRAELLTQLGEFRKATALYQEVKKIFLEKGDFERYLKCQVSLIRLYSELEALDQVLLIREEIEQLINQKKMSPASRIYYALGVSALYQGQYEAAYDYAQKSLSLALDNDNKEDACYAISLLAATYRLMGRYQEALVEIYNLKVFFEVLPIPEIQISSILLNGLILMDLKKFDQAIQVLLQGYELLKNHKSILLPIQLMGLLAQAYRYQGAADIGSIYIQLAAKMVDPVNMPRLYQQIKKELAKFENIPTGDYDLIYMPEKGIVLEKRLGKIEFRNQFVLLDLLHLFLSHPGEILSKEYLVEKVWKEAYDPQVHDNKIYVTIKRLRKLLEPDYEKPRYIFRAKNGYFLNKNVKVLIQHQ
ncbi:MAG: winged helix-turn-helix domain-containing protein [Bdellovibrionaceae bacterium]|nr:winged helix-turn-helix domain-containing protein [Pseudobdellovibrionaceae bacterium]MDW8190817.1 winged helix-turn-helix domain-containing protein [Pseudobdellovibrionaceae bacterium]